jgi:hypothetical protein
MKTYRKLVGDDSPTELQTTELRTTQLGEDDD